jgi:hypothetical protein
MVVRLALHRLGVAPVRAQPWKQQPLRVDPLWRVSDAANRGKSAASCSEATRVRIRHRLSFGRDFNAAPHQATSGSAISVNPSCTFYLNYFTSSTFDTGKLRDPAGSDMTTVRYRFSTKNRQAIATHSPAVDQWGFMPRSCVTDWRDVVFNNEDD